MLDPSAAWIAEMHAAALGGGRVRAVADDPVLAEGLRRDSLSHLLHWALFNVQHPGRRVPPNVTADSLATARDLVRRGLDATVLDTYRTGQYVAWRRWMQTCFDLTSDVGELRELIDVAARSMNTFVDDTIDAIDSRMNVERDHLIRNTNTERLTAATLILEGAPIPQSRAEIQLGYRLTGPQTAAIVWGAPSTSAAQLEDAADALGQAVDATDRLTIVASVASLWLWLPVAVAPTAASLAKRLEAAPQLRIAIGRPGRDIDGFRRSHLDAATTQRLLTRLTSPQQVAHYEDVALVALVTSDSTRADEFVRDTLGDLLTADPDIRETVATYASEQFNTSRTAERLYTHRNTIIRRLARADELMPLPLAQRPVAVAAALEVLRWRGER
ncbi:PucR family transcriptional regulator [Mycobacterium sp. URHB0044]|uniref:PucR family transcriptional regulator n=1 Tax=Mycobacterium sp. URHB0044 TaxID=1380386 RepID=UPI000A95A0E2